MSEYQTFQTARPTCPHCGHELDEEEMLYGKPTCDEDLHALAPNEGRAVVQCPRCHGDGRDPQTDYLLPCPACQGEQRP